MIKKLWFTHSYSDDFLFSVLAAKRVCRAPVNGLGIYYNLFTPPHEKIFICEIT